MNRKGAVPWFIYLAIIAAVVYVSGSQLIGVASIIQGSLTGILPAQFYSGGMNILSISKADIAYGTGAPTGSYLVTAAVGSVSGADSVEATITPSQFKSESGLESKNPVTIKVQSFDETRKYVFTPGGALADDQWFFRMQRFGAFGGKNQCNAVPQYAAARFKWAIQSNPFTEVGCVWTEQAAVGRDMQLGVVENAVTFAFTKPGEQTVTMTVNSNGGVGTAQVSGGAVTASFAGSLVTGNVPNPGTNYKAYWNLQSRNWNVVDRQSWTSAMTDYTTVEQDLTRMANNAIGPNLNELAIKIDRHNGITGTVVATDKTGELNPGCTSYGCTVWTDETHLDSPSLQVKIDRSLTVGSSSPVITFRIPAAWVGIRTGVAKPQLSGLNCPSFKSGDNGKLTGTVSNIGESAGRVSVELTNCGAISQAGSIAFDLPPGGSAPFTLYTVTSGSAQSQTNSCTVTATDVSGQGGSATAQVGCTMEKAATCTVGQYRTTGQCYAKCEANGQYGEGLCCDVNEEVRISPTGGAPACVAVGGGGGDPFGNLGRLLAVFIMSFVIALVIMALAGKAFFRPLLNVRALLAASFVLAIILTLAFSPLVIQAANLVGVTPAMLAGG